MKKQTTGREIQRVDFVDSLYKSLKQKAQQAQASQQRWLKMASVYLDDGMEISECVELLEIDGLSREAAQGYANMAMENRDVGADGEHEYTFQFEDSFGRVWNSADLGRIVRASTDDDAWRKAEDIVFSDVYECDPEKLISVNRVS